MTANGDDPRGGRAAEAHEPGVDLTSTDVVGGRDDERAERDEDGPVPEQRGGVAQGARGTTRRPRRAAGLASIGAIPPAVGWSYRLP